MNAGLSLRLGRTQLVNEKSPSCRLSGSARRRAVVAILSSVVVAITVYFGLAVVGATSLWVRDPAYADREAALGELGRDRPVVVFLGTSRVGNGFAAGRVGDRTSITPAV